MTGPILATPESRQLGRELSDMRAQIETLQAGLRATQLGRSTLYGSLQIKNDDGTLTGVIGSDGVTVVNGPPPPRPNTPELTPIIAGISIGWNGEFPDAARPANFSHLLIYASGAGETFIHGESNLVGTLTEAGTMPLVPLNAEPMWVRFVAVNTSTPPKESEPSFTAGPCTPEMVVAQEILDGIVTEVALAQGAVTEAKIAAGAVGTAQLQGGAVTVAQLADGAVNAAKLVDGSITGPKIAPLAVTAPAIAAGAVTAPAIAASAISADKIAANAVSADKIQAGSIESDKLAANAVVAGKIAASTIGANEIAANSIVAGKIAASAITTEKIAAGAIQAAQIAVGAVSAEKIVAGAVTAEKISALAITTDKIAANAIRAGNIEAGAVTASALTADMVITKRIIAGSKTGARTEMHPTSGFQAFDNNNARTFWADATTGNITAVGTYRSAFTGERVEIITTGDFRLYQSSGAYSEITNITNGVIMRGPYNTSSQTGHVTFSTTGAELRYGTTTGTSLSYFSVGGTFINSIAPVIGFRIDRRRAPADSTANRLFFLTTNSSGSDVADSVLHYYPRNTTDYNPIIRAVGKNVGLMFETGGAGILGSGDFAYGNFTANNIYGNINPASSETVKNSIEEISLTGGRTSWDLIEGAPALAWKYDHETPTPRGDKPRDPDGNPILLQQRRRNADGTEVGGEAPEAFETVEAEWSWSEPAARAQRTHRFPLAEDLALLDPNLINRDRGDDPKKTAVDLRDVVGILWDAVDMLIKRNRILEERLATMPILRQLNLPGRPQKGDVREGIGAIVAGRTKRQIDTATGQIRDRIRGAVEDRLK